MFEEKPPMDTAKTREAAVRMLEAAEFPSDEHQVDLMLRHPWAAGIMVRQLQRTGKLEEVEAEKAILDEHHGTDTATEYGPLHQAAHGNAPEADHGE